MSDFFPVVPPSGGSPPFSTISVTRKAVAGYPTNRNGEHNVYMENYSQTGRHTVPAVESLSRLFDSIAGPTIAISGDFHLIAANEAAHHMLEASDVLAVRHGHVTTAHATDDQSFRAAVSSVRGAAADQRGPKVVRLERRATGAVVLLSMIAVDIVVAGRPRRLTLVRVLDTEYELDIPDSHLNKAWGLTRAESRVVCGLINGLSVKQVAERRFVSVHTVRTQLKSIFSKTGTTRQAELVRQVVPLAMSAGGYA